jgi:hypothetical protein
MPLNSDIYDSQHYETEQWRRLSRRIKERDNYTCRNCGINKQGAPGMIFHAHHIIPHLKGGADEESNLITLCEDCHSLLHLHLNKNQRRSYRGRIYGAEPLRKYSWAIFLIGFALAFFLLYIGALVSPEIGALGFCGGLIMTFILTLTYMYYPKRF